MRKLMWFSIGFFSACAAGAYLISNISLLICAVVLLVLSVVLLICKVKISKLLLSISIGAVIGAGWFLAFYNQQINMLIPYDGQTVTTTATVTDYSYETDYGVAADCSIKLAGKSYKSRIYLTSLEMVTPGDEIAGNFKIRMTTGNSQKSGTYHQGNGIFLLAYADEQVELRRAEKQQLRYLPAMLRKHITDTLDAVFPEDSVAFVRALLLGDSSLLSYETDTAFKISGIRHVIAVSGLHVSILFSLVYILSGKRRAMTALLGIPVLILFAAVAGFTPSIMRACIMQCLMILALLLNKEYDPSTALSFAVLVMLAINPLTVTSVSFQLSVGCLVGILLFYNRFNGYLLKLLKVQKGTEIKQKLSRWLCSSVAITLSAMVVTTPLSVLYFGTVSILGVITNLLTLWIISFVFYGVMLAWICGAIWLPAGKVVAWVISWAVRYVVGTARLISGIPFAAVYSCSIYIVIWLIFCYLLFALLLCSKKKRVILSSVCALIGLLSALFLSYLEPRLDDFRVTAFDVGQGQCLLIQSKNENYLVDCGGDDAVKAADTVAAKLLSQGISELDGLFLTHYDADHAKGAQMLLCRVGAEKLYLPDVTADNPLRTQLENTYADKITWVRQRGKIVDGDLTILLYPGQNPNDGNESSLCILFQHEKCDILITGDRDVAGERKLLQQAQLPDLEILVVGHHGSKNSTSLELLTITKPDVAVISAGRDNRYGHPSPEVLRRLEMVNCRIFRTDQLGTIIFRR